MDNPRPPLLTILRRWPVVRLLAIAIPALVIVAGIIFRSQISGFFGPRVPLPPCGAPAIQLSDYKFRMQNLASAAQVPLGKSGVAYWIEGSTAHYVFALSPTGDNKSLLDHFALGDRIKIAWGDCTSEDFIMTSFEKSAPASASLLDQSAPGMTVYVPGSGSDSGWTILALRHETIVAPPRVSPTPNPIQAEISFLDQSTSADGRTLRLKISIKNTGSNPIHISQSDISLAALAPASVDPGLPIDIQPGAAQNLTIDFAKPTGNTAILKILDFSMDLYY